MQPAFTTVSAFYENKGDVLEEKICDWKMNIMINVGTKLSNFAKEINKYQELSTPQICEHIMLCTNALYNEEEVMERNNWQL